MTSVESSKAVAPTTGRKVHLPALDGLRGVAILGVLLFHTGHLTGGFLGVDLFFALSGYLITDLLLREAEGTGGVSLMAFWGRRVRRLLPALVVMLVVVTVLVRLVGSSELVTTTLADGPWVQWDLINWHLLAESASYWDQFGDPRVFEHLWSIAVEEQFYVVWPVVVLVIVRCGRRADRWVLTTALVISLASLVLMIVLVDPADPTRVYTGTDTRAFSLLLGAMVATRPVRDLLTKLSQRWAAAILAVLAVGIGSAWVLVGGTNSLWLYTGGLFLHSLAAAVLIGLCVAAPGTLVARILAWRPLRWLGLISYSLYLWHWPVVVLLSGQQQKLGVLSWTLLVCTVSIAVAALSKYLVEDPIRFRAGWARGRRGALVFVAVMVGLTVLWLALPGPAAPSIDITQLG
ncbi:MAG TPA: acyltransferase [Pseudonocardiaceae bacterium]|jgi:peptidoglycan/LPS O-acetylase OafA/YrhL|nr:acyltransferase [Pseudonocardiaceae bacterium]